VHGQRYKVGTGIRAKLSDALMYLDTDGRGQSPKPKTLSGLLPHTFSIN